MRLKKLGATLLIAAALSAVLAGSAFATATTTAAKWYTGSGTELTGSQAITAEQSGSATFTTTVMVPVTVQVHATGVECVSCSISNSGGSGTGTGKLKFTGVSVEQPPHCATASSVTTEKLTIGPDYMESVNALTKFAPAAGDTAGFMQFELTECQIPISMVAKGFIFGKDANVTGVQAASQTVNFSPTINSTAGGTLAVGTEPLGYTASDIFKAGGLTFGVH
jgi:hypothetical protein